MGKKRERNKLTDAERMMNKRLGEIVDNMMQTDVQEQHVNFYTPDGQVGASVILVVGPKTEQAINAVSNVMSETREVVH